MKNRGRFQTQGDGFEDSVSWSQETPLTAKDGLDKLNELETKIPKSESNKREKEFEKARKFIENAEEKGGVDAPVSKTYKTEGTKDVRVDIEVIKGKAFIPVIILLLALVFFFWR